MVGIVLLNWQNWPDTLRCARQLRPVLSARCFLVIVDNGSRDDSLAHLGSAGAAVVIANPRNDGFGGGCNLGIRAALGRGADFVWLLNSDTETEAATLPELIATALADPRVGAVGGVLYDFHRPWRVQEWGGGWFHRATGLTGVHTSPPARGRPAYICGGCLLLRRTALEQVGLFDSLYFMYGEDADLGLRLSAAGWRLAVAPRASVRHRGGGSAPSLIRAFYVSAANARTVRKYAPRPVLAVFLVLALRCGKNVATGHWRRAAASALGVAAGWRAFRLAQPYGPAAVRRGLPRWSHDAALPPSRPGRAEGSQTQPGPNPS